MPEIAQRAKISYERKPKTLHSFFALKFHDGDEDRAKVDNDGKIIIKIHVDFETKMESYQEFLGYFHFDEE